MQHAQVERVYSHCEACGATGARSAKDGKQLCKACREKSQPPIRMIAQVNHELKRMGRSERLVRGKGYYYFVNGDTHKWYSSSVYVSHAESLPLEKWIAEFFHLLTCYEREL